MALHFLIGSNQMLMGRGEDRGGHVAGRAGEVWCGLLIVMRTLRCARSARKLETDK